MKTNAEGFHVFLFLRNVKYSVTRLVETQRIYFYVLIKQKEKMFFFVLVLEQLSVLPQTSKLQGKRSWEQKRRKKIHPVVMWLYMCFRMNFGDQISVFHT